MGFWGSVKSGLNQIPGTGFLGSAYDGITGQIDRGKNEFRGVDQNGNMALQAHTASDFANRGQGNFAALGNEASDERARLRGLADGTTSLSAEQLRQGLQQNLAGQQAMAASARPANAAMAARTASMNAANIGSGLAGQQATAGIQERQAATMALGNMINQNRQQELDSSLQGRGLAMQGYGNIEGANTDRFRALTGSPTGEENQLAFGSGLLKTAAGFSDRRLKKDIKDGSADADDFIRSMKAYSYRYKDDKFGKGDRVGFMAQDLEKSKAGRSAVIETPHGKAFDAAALSGANTAAIARLGERLAKVEGRK